MRVLVLITDYPRPDGSHAYMFAHVRNLYYRKKGIDVTVLNFGCYADYYIDDIRVISENTYKQEHQHYDIAISHAANIRKHYLFIKKYERNFSKFVFFFHGQEILYLRKNYSLPYPYMARRGFRTSILQDIYDWIKLRLWRQYYKKLAPKSEFIFVSQWLKEKFKTNTKLSDKDLLYHCHIINNSIGKTFEDNSYDYQKNKKYDFVVLRTELDLSHRCIDLVSELATKYPDLKFLVIGRGKYFQYYEKPENVEWIQRSMGHDEMLEFLDESRCGLLLTRQDTQGVMTCELAAYGMPVITSDIDVCHEFFDEIPNVALISNELNQDIRQIVRQLSENLPYKKFDKYFSDNTIFKEVVLFNKICEYKDM